MEEKKTERLSTQVQEVKLASREEDEEITEVSRKGFDFFFFVTKGFDNVWNQNLLEVFKLHILGGCISMYSIANIFTG